MTHLNLTRRTLIAAGGSAALIAGPAHPRAIRSLENFIWGRGFQNGNQAYVTEVSFRGNTFLIRWQHRGLPVEVELEFNSLDPLRILSDLDRGLNLHWRPARQAERDPYRASILRPVVASVVELADSMDEDPVFLLLSMVQGMIFYERGSYAQPGTATLLTGRGDCSDSSVLFGALLARLQRLDRTIGKAPLWLLASNKRASHMLAAVRNHRRAGREPTSYSGTNFLVSAGSDGNLRYYLAETTGTGWEIGRIPNAIENLHWQLHIPKHLS